MNITCPVRVPCSDSAILNLSAEDPDVFYWGGYYYPTPCRQVLCAPTYYAKDCFGIVYSTTSQADADNLAKQASIDCLNPIPTPSTTCTNEAQTAIVTCADGTVVSFTCPAGTFSATVQGSEAACIAAANAQALAYAQQQVSLLAQTQCVNNTTHCSFTTASILNNGTIGSSYSDQLVASISGFPVGFYLVSGSLPPGLSLNSSGTITGTPTTNGTYQFSVKALTAVTSCTKQFQITVGGCSPPLTLTMDPAFIAAVNAYTPNSGLDGIFHLVDPDCSILLYQMTDPIYPANNFALSLVYGLGLYFRFSGSFAYDGAFFKNNAVGTIVPASKTDPRGSYQIGLAFPLVGYSSGSTITIT